MIRKENGVTLAALIITVILLIILLSVSMNGVVGQKSVVGTAEEAADNYEIGKDKESIEQLVQNILITHELSGENEEIMSILINKMKEENWINNATLGENEQGKDILVTLTNGNLFEVFYDEDYGQTFVEYLGVSSKSTPVIQQATYNSSGTNISVTAQGGSNTEILYKDEVIQNSNIRDTGWYKVRVTASSGNLRYAWVRVSNETDSVDAPTITITPNETGENGWYTQQVAVTLSSANDIYYKTSMEGEYALAATNPLTIQMISEGRMVIYAYAQDANENQSKPKHVAIKYDRTAPTVSVTPVPILQANTWVTENVVISLENSEDVTNVITQDDVANVVSGIDGYYYWEVIDDLASNNGENNKVYVKGKDKKVTVASDGEKTLAFKTKDRAGNVSASSATLAIKKDSTPPEDFIPRIINESSSSFTISANAIDVTSGIAYYNFYVEGSIVQGSGANNTSGVCRVENEIVEEKSNYAVYVEAFDNAGNKKTSATVTAWTGEKVGMIGKYVQYVPTVATYAGVNNSDTYAGVNTNGSFTTDSTLNWRILDINENTLTLISDTTPSDLLYLSGATGYNNAVKLLNEICNTCYGTSSYTSSARSIKIEDIEAVTGYSGTPSRKFYRDRLELS